MTPKLSESVQTGLVVGGVFVPAMYTTFQGIFTGQYQFAVFGGIIIFTTFFLGINRSLPWRRELVVSDYKPPQNAA